MSPSHRNFTTALLLLSLAAPGCVRAQRDTDKPDMDVKALSTGLDRVDVEFEGRRRDFVMAPQGEFAVRVDGDLVDQGRRTFAVEAKQVEHPASLRIVAMDPIKVRLDVEAD